MNWIRIVYLSFTCLVPQVISAETRTIYAEYEYVMGDNDTRSDARRLCFLEARRMCLEKAGVYVESRAEMTMLGLTKNEIKTYAAGILTVEIVSEETKYNSDSLVISLKVKADVDISILRSQLERVKEDKSLGEKHKKLRMDYDNLEKEIRDLQQKLRQNDSWEESASVRTRRATAFRGLSMLDKLRQEALDAIEDNTQRAIKYVEIGMTPEEVASLIGKPRTKSSSHLNYGKVWVVIRDGVVNCVVKAEVFKIYNSRSNYRPSDIIK